jgi:cytochrome c biogenesis protein CcmG, thiol:disulfide interchange protein DsbE
VNVGTWSLAREPVAPHSGSVRILALVALVLAGLAAPACGDGDGAAPSALELELVSLADGDATTLGALTEDLLVVNFWAPWCTPCVAEMPAFDAVHRTLDPSVRIVGVTDDPDRTAALELAATTGVTYPLLVDPAGRLRSALGVASLPSTAFLTADGEVLEVHRGVYTEAQLRARIEAHHAI